MAKLTTLRRTVLRLVRDREDEFEPTSTGMRTLIWLVQAGFVEGPRLQSNGHARRWSITEAGRLALKENPNG